MEEQKGTPKPASRFGTINDQFTTIGKSTTSQRIESETKKTSKALKKENSKEAENVGTGEEIKKLSIYMPPGRHRRFKSYAVNHDEDMNSIVNRLIEELLASEE